ncbi:MAG: NAD-binding protein [Syntrophobacterales bacterium]|nr:NAD-binding protein [Syntrophobacterales bacterium]
MKLVAKTRTVTKALAKERFFFVAPITLAVIIIASVGVFYAERHMDAATIHSIWDGVWWAFVTICTVGYGDKVPLSFAGKIIGIFLMISGIGLLSMLTATVASVLVEQKIKEGKGLETIKDKGHIVVCGWNNNTEEVIRGLTAGTSGSLPIVLINELPIDEMDILRAKYGKQNVTFLRGDFVHEEVLLRANITRAGFALIMADFSGTHPRDRADDRTILGALAVKSLAPKIKVIAELLDGESKPHLKRANVDEIIVRGEHIGSLLAGAVRSPGLSKVYAGLLSFEGAGMLKRDEIPKQYVGHTFGELSAYYRGKRKAILIGLLKESQGVKVEDVLSDDTSAIDLFIREKLKASNKGVLQREEATKVIINPDDHHVITADDHAVILSSPES